MMTSEDRLEEALDAYNTKISALEDTGDSDELLEAYINRGTILMMMESYTAAESDFEEAVESIQIRERKGIPTDLGLLIRAYENRGQLSCGSDGLRMLDDYRHIIERLPQLRIGTRYFTAKDIVIMCINCAEDLLGHGYYEETLAFIDKASEILKGKHDTWAENRYMDICGIKAETMKMIKRYDESVSLYSEAIRIGERLHYESSLETPCLLSLCYISKGDVHKSLGDYEETLRDYLDALDSMERMLNVETSDNRELMSELCEDIASILMNLGRIEESEKYLLRSIRYTLPEIKESSRPYE